MRIRTLLAIPSPALAARVEGLLDTRDVSVLRARDPGEVWQILQREEVDLVVAAPGTDEGPTQEWVDAVRGLPDPPDVVVLAEREDASHRASLLAAGCLAVLNARIRDRELRETFRTLVGRLAQDAATRLAAQRQASVHGLENVVHRSPAMAAVVEMARRVAGADSSLLLLGETGVGKERLARAIHYESARSAGPFVAVNCGAIPEGLLESELFGHEQGAFTGAVRARRGHFEVAHQGTLFLDEIGELPLHLQVKLLRVLEDRQIQRLGSERPERVDVRIIAATNRELETEVDSRRFRADLFYRLAVVTLTIPPLRNRTDDILDLVDFHLSQFRRTLGKPVAGVTPEAMEALISHPWPGNVRELINVLERAVLLMRTDRIGIPELPPAISGVPVAARTASEGAGAALLHEEVADLPIREARQAVVVQFEREYLTRLLERTGGRIGETAILAGITERALYGLMRRTGLDKADFR